MTRSVNYLWSESTPIAIALGSSSASLSRRADESQGTTAANSHREVEMRNDYAQAMLARTIVTRLSPERLVT